MTKKSSPDTPPATQKGDFHLATGRGVLDQWMAVGRCQGA